jgi:hypothetical protein
MLAAWGSLSARDGWVYRRHFVEDVTYIDTVEHDIDDAEKAHGEGECSGKVSARLRNFGEDLVSISP